MNNEEKIKSYENNEERDKIEESVSEGEYKKETDTSTKFYGVNSTISSAEIKILKTIKAGLEAYKTEINLDKYVSYITNSKKGMN